MLAMVTALTVAAFSPASFAAKSGLIVIYIALCWWVIRPLLLRLLHYCGAHEGTLSPNLVGILMAAIFLSGMTTYHLGIFAIFGGFMLGVLLHDQNAFVRAWREKVGDFVLVFFLPMFFTYSGLRTNIGALDSAQRWGWCVLLMALATVRQVRRMLFRRPPLGHERTGSQGDRHHDEHARPDGTGGHQRRPGPRRHSAVGIHHAGVSWPSRVRS